MVYPFDIGTKEELRNTFITENGFYIETESGDNVIVALGDV